MGCILMTPIGILSLSTIILPNGPNTYSVVDNLSKYNSRFIEGFNKAKRFYFIVHLNLNVQCNKESNIFNIYPNI